MKRELAALETGSLVLDSIGRKPRHSKQINGDDSNGVSAGLVYKRVKRSVQVEEVDLLSERSNGVVIDLKDHKVKSVGEPSLMQVECKDIDGNSLAMKVEFKGLLSEDTKVFEISAQDKDAVMNLPTEDNGLVKNVQNDEGVNNLLMKVDLLSKRSNGVVKDLKDHDMQKEVESTCDEGLKSVGEPSLMEVECKDIDGNSLAVKGEFKELLSEDTKVVEILIEDNDVVMNLPTNDNGLVKNVENDEGVNMQKEVESTCDEGLKSVGEPSLMEVECKDIDGNFLAVKEEFKELLSEDTKVVEISIEDNDVVMNLPTNDNGLVKNVENDEGVNNLLMEERHLTRKLEARDVSSTGLSDLVIVYALSANYALIEADKDKVVEGTLVKSPSTMVVNGKENNFSVERYQRRFTRSALKSEVDALMLDTDSVMQNGENANTVMRKSSAEAGNDGTFSQTHLTDNNFKFKNSSVEKHPRRFTRSSLKPKVEDMDSSLMEASDPVIVDKENTKHVIIDENAEADIDKDVEESKLATPKRKMEMKMSKQIALAKIPSTVKELLETGLLEGCPVYYNGSKSSKLCGRIRGLGILCTCGMCQGCKVIPPSLFEIHACNTYKRAAQYIYLENGRNFIQILKACKSTRLSTLEATVQNAIGPLPEKKLIVCRNCKDSFSTMDAESSEAVCSSCVMSSVSPIGPVFSSRKMCRSSNFACSLRPSPAAPACDVLPDRSQEKSIEKSSESVCPLRPSQVASACDGLPDSSWEKSSGKLPEAVFSPKVRSSPRFAKSSETKTAKKLAENGEEVFVAPKHSSLSMRKSSETKTCEKLMNPKVVARTCSSPMRKSSGTRTCEKLMKKSSKAASSPELSGSTRAGKSPPANDCRKTPKRFKKEALTPKPVKTPSVGCSSEKKTSGKITRKDNRLHKLVFEDDILPDGTELGYYARGQKLLYGYKKGSGIFCSCCETVVSASQFEAHAGCASRRKPYCYIYTSNGVSLHELSLNLIKDRAHSTKFNDDLCSICADGGNLLLCDGCPRAFHVECASLSNVPCGKWYCKYCQNLFEKERLVSHNANAVAAGRVTGVDPMEQITTRSIRIVDNLASELSSCILCRGYDFCKSGFGPRTIILCDQCEKEYHVGCLKDHNMADLTELPDGKWFCSMDCGRIESALQNLLVRGAEKLPESLVDSIRKKHVEKGSECATDFDVSWRLLSGKITSPETRSLLSQAVAIFHESFSPIIDVMSGQDLIAAMVYGRSVAGQEYGGMYCAVLTINSVVVSAGIFRVFGSEVAELPLVATSNGDQGKGYFQALFTCIERLLAFLKVKSFVLPAAEEAESIWTDHFGFKKMTLDQLREFQRNYWSVVRFQGTSMLHKSVPECRIIRSGA